MLTDKIMEVLNNLQNNLLHSANLCPAYTISDGMDFGCHGSSCSGRCEGDCSGACAFDCDGSCSGDCSGSCSNDCVSEYR